MQRIRTTRGAVCFQLWLELSKTSLKVHIFLKWSSRRFQRVTSQHGQRCQERVILHLVDGYVESKLTRTSNTNNNNNASVLEAADKRSLSNRSDVAAKLDFSTLQSIAHQTGTRIVVHSRGFDQLNFLFLLPLQHDLRRAY